MGLAKEMSNLDVTLSFLAVVAKLQRATLEFRLTYGNGIIADAEI